MQDQRTANAQGGTTTKQLQLMCTDKYKCTTRSQKNTTGFPHKTARTKGPERQGKRMSAHLTPRVPRQRASHGQVSAITFLH